MTKKEALLAWLNEIRSTPMDPATMSNEELVHAYRDAWIRVASGDGNDDDEANVGKYIVAILSRMRSKDQLTTGGELPRRSE